MRHAIIGLSLLLFLLSAVTAPILVVAASAFVVPHPARQQATENSAPLGRFVNVPLDHDNPGLGTIGLYVELGRPFDPAKPTVFALVDGQQFYIRKGAVRALQDSLFGDGFNLIGIPGRGTEDAVLAHVRRGDSIDWQRAWELLRAEQWIEDIEHVRRAVVGPDARIRLYGRSGGGLLVHQFLARHGRSVSHVFTQASVNRFLDAKLGLSSDTFWTDLGRSDPMLMPPLLGAFMSRPDQRARYLLLLQRQNFFVPVGTMPSERARLITSIVNRDEDTLTRYSKEYQVEAALNLLSSPTPAINVRLFELFAPVAAARQDRGTASRIDPDIEVGELFGAPLFALLKAGKITAPQMEFQSLHSVEADIYMLAGRFDHTADYRSQIALASHYPRHRLLLLSDDHSFLALQRTGRYADLVQAALSAGIHGPRERGVEKGLDQLMYREY